MVRGSGYQISGIPPRSITVLVNVKGGCTMRYAKSGGQTRLGPPDRFTGTVQMDLIRNSDDQSAVGCAHVRFAPGARTAWHHHPKGQTLYVTDGIGLVATRDGVQEIRPGDVVYIEPGEQHWHGATPDRFMAHVAIQEADENGQVVTWLEHVSDDEYSVR
jgi:quercetin dioxygenase-like cupin family protein